MVLGGCSQVLGGFRSFHVLVTAEASVKKKETQVKTANLQMSDEELSTHCTD